MESRGELISIITKNSRIRQVALRTPSKDAAEQYDASCNSVPLHVMICNKIAFCLIPADCAPIKFIFYCIGSRDSGIL